MGILPQLIINSLIAGAMYTLVALGFNLIFGAIHSSTVSPEPVRDEPTLTAA